MRNPYIPNKAARLAALGLVVAALIAAPLAMASGLARSGWPYSVALLLVPR